MDSNIKKPPTYANIYYMNLVEMAALIRKVILIVAAVIALIVTFFILKPALKGMWITLFPPKDLPTPIYGKLDPLEFIEKPITNANPKITLNTKDGKLPREIPKSMIVYQIALPPYNFSAGKDAQTHAAQLGFTDDELITDLKDKVYGWRDKETNGILRINIETKEISLNTPMAGKAGLIASGILKKDQAKGIAVSMLNGISRFDDPPYIKGFQTEIEGRIVGSRIEKSEVAFETQLVRVDFFRSANDYPTLGPDPKQGLINVTLIKSESNREGDLTALNFPIIEYHSWEIVPPLPTQTATYPLLPIVNAWEAVAENRKGVIVSVIPKDKSIFDPYSPVRADHILINNIYLAYYDTVDRQNFLQPIYVFEGTYNVGNRPGGAIVIYFPALDGRYIKPVEKTQSE